MMPELTSLIARNPPGVPYYHNLVVHICEALAYIHEQNLVHCDVKAENIFYMGLGQTFYLADFGCAYRMPSTFEYSGAGTEEMKAPEQAGYHVNPQTGELYRGRITVSPASDMWALGLTLFEAYHSQIHVPEFESQMRHEIRLAVVRKYKPELQDLVQYHPAYRMTARDYLQKFKQNPPPSEGGWLDGLTNAGARSGRAAQPSQTNLEAEFPVGATFQECIYSSIIFNPPLSEHNVHFYQRAALAGSYALGDPHPPSYPPPLDRPLAPDHGASRNYRAPALPPFPAGNVDPLSLPFRPDRPRPAQARQPGPSIPSTSQHPHAHHSLMAQGQTPTARPRRSRHEIAPTGAVQPLAKKPLLALGGPSSPPFIPRTGKSKPSSPSTSGSRSQELRRQPLRRDQSMASPSRGARNASSTPESPVWRPAAPPPPTADEDQTRASRPGRSGAGPAPAIPPRNISDPIDIPGSSSQPSGPPRGSRSARAEPQQATGSRQKRVPSQESRRARDR
jgi:serine/threonine protein kinase